MSEPRFKVGDWYRIRGEPYSEMRAGKVSEDGSQFSPLSESTQGGHWFSGEEWEHCDPPVVRVQVGDWVWLSEGVGPYKIANLNDGGIDGLAALADEAGEIKTYGNAWSLQPAPPPVSERPGIVYGASAFSTHPRCECQAHGFDSRGWCSCVPAGTTIGDLRQRGELPPEPEKIAT